MNHRSFASRQIGDFLVTVLSDGNMAASLDLLSGIDTAEAGEIQRVTGITDPGHIQINSYLIRGQGRTILVDSGTGGLNNAGGLLRENLRATGIQPEDVDTILLTHGHPATTLIGGQIAGYSCKSAATPFVPYFVSSLDALVWRSGLPEGLYPEALIPGQRELGSQAGANMWGNIYPRAVSSDQKLQKATGEDGATWIGGQKRGGKGQPAIKPTHDLAKAGYNMMNNLPVTSNSSVGASSCNGSVCQRYPNSETAASAVVKVLGSR